MTSSVLEPTFPPDLQIRYCVHVSCAGLAPYVYEYDPDPRALGQCITQNDPLEYEYSNIAGVYDALRRRGWKQTKRYGWLCPVCQAFLAKHANG